VKLEYILDIPPPVLSRSLIESKLTPSPDPNLGKKTGQKYLSEVESFNR